MAVGGKRQAVRIAGGDRDHTGQARNLERRRTIPASAVAKLERAVRPPGEHAAIPCRGNRVREASRQRRHPGEGRHHGGNSLEGRPAVTELPRRTLAPGVQQAIGRGGQRMQPTRGQRTGTKRFGQRVGGRHDGAGVCSRLERARLQREAADEQRRAGRDAAVGGRRIGTTEGHANRDRRVRISDRDGRPGHVAAAWLTD